MKLPNFLQSDDFVRLKQEMGVPLDKLGSVRAIKLRSFAATRDEIRQLSEEGLEVEKDDVVPLPDGTLSYKDRRVLLYIRDVSQYSDKYSDPKFHIANCTTLQQMRENKRIARYVIASREDGFFHMHYINKRLRTDKRLNVCQNCLDRLKYKGFQLSMRGDRRKTAVQKFSIADFFVTYPKTLHHSMPTHTDRTAPTNDYSPNFSRFSRAFRRDRNSACETCGISLSGPAMSRYLHVHHINGLKYDNGDENLKVLCIHCHALEPSHHHIRGTPQYREFEAIWQRWHRGL